MLSAHHTKEQKRKQERENPGLYIILETIVRQQQYRVEQTKCVCDQMEELNGFAAEFANISVLAPEVPEARPTL